MCVESVCGVCAESVWDVRFVCCVLLCIVVCVSLCVVLVLVLVCNVWCVVCVVVCSVCAVWCGGVVVCGTLKTPCVGSKCFRVSVQNAPVCTGKTPACVDNITVQASCYLE